MTNSLMSFCACLTPSAVKGYSAWTASKRCPSLTSLKSSVEYVWNSSRVWTYWLRTGRQTAREGRNGVQPDYTGLKDTKGWFSKLL